MPGRRLSFAELLCPERSIDERKGLAPKDDVGPVASSLDSVSNLILVGHQPFMTRLLGQLVVRDPDPRVFQLQGGGIVCLDQDETGWFIRWTTDAAYRVIRQQRSS